jgi:hypothetical protein
MKLISALLVGVVAALGSAQNAPVARVHTVYVMPMTNGFDQYLANRLANLGVFQVVADPKKADAVLTDGLGESFEGRLEELFPLTEPTPPPAKPAKKAEAAKTGKAGEPAGVDAKDKDKDAADEDAGKPETQRPRFSTFRRANGTVFLVDAHDRTVLWSVYDRPKNATSGELDRTAERIAGRLKREIKSK